MHTSATLVAALVGSAAAHMEMQFPAPFRSKYNPNAASAQIDYNMVSPLSSSGSDYPCKGYATDLGSAAGKSTASFAAGQKGNITVVGGAAHGGGSCQISLSTDGAKTFTVLQSIVGNCPTQGSGTFDFTMPADAPAGDHVLAWTWHNQIGNREMYMNCAAITVTGGASASKDKRAAAYSTRPGIFLANIGAAGGNCQTKETTDVDYPDPGPDVVRQGSKAEKPTCGVESGGNTGSGSGSGSSGGSSGGSEGAGSAASSAASPTPTAGDGGSGSGSGSGSGNGGGVFATAAPTTLTKSTTQAAQATAGSGSGSSSGSGTGSGSGSGSGTNSGSGSGEGNAGSTPAASAAPTSGSASGQSAAQNTPGTACADEGTWVCLTGGASYQRCASGRWTQVQSVAAGTTCSGSPAGMLAIKASSAKMLRGRRIKLPVVAGV